MKVYNKVYPLSKPFFIQNRLDHRPHTNRALHARAVLLEYVGMKNIVFFFIKSRHISEKLDWCGGGKSGHLLRCKSEKGSG